MNGRQSNTAIISQLMLIINLGVSQYTSFSFERQPETTEQPPPFYMMRRRVAKRK